MMADILQTLAFSIFVLLGLVHLIYTFFTRKFYPFEESFVDKMKEHTLQISKDANLWKAWTGFNASHSAGAIFFGMINLLLIRQSFYSQLGVSIYLLNCLFIGFFLFLSKRYWFKIPLLGISLAGGLYCLHILLILLT